MLPTLEQGWARASQRLALHGGAASPYATEIPVYLRAKVGGDPGGHKAGVGAIARCLNFHHVTAVVIQQL